MISGILLYCDYLNEGRSVDPCCDYFVKAFMEESDRAKLIDGYTDTTSPP